MIKTSALFAQNDLDDIIKLFDGAQALELEIEFNNQIEFVVTVTINQEKEHFKYPNIQEVDDIYFKRMAKRYLKRSLYISLSKHLNKTLPWGSLTGIRPVKLARQLKKEGHNFDDEFRNFFFVSDKKIDLVNKIVSVQELVEQKNGSLFINIPFCPSRCSYCSFISAITSKSQEFLQPYTKALILEINAAKKLNNDLKSIYIGGGTPTALPLSYLQEILKAAAISSVDEFTVEAGRADCINEDILKALNDAKVTRICINPQTFNDKTLKKIGRNHTVDDFLKVYEISRKYNFDINIDLIAGLEGESVADFLYGVEKAVSLKPENITVHTISLKAGSLLKEKNEKLPDCAHIEEMTDKAMQILSSARYQPYYLYRQKYTAGNLENTGYSLKGKECRYNIDIMQEDTDIIACGANAMSKRVFVEQNKIERFKNPKDIKTYLEKVSQNILSKDAFFS